MAAEKPKVVYVAPNRSHHFGYAEGLARAGLLQTFISGYPRLKGAFATLQVPREQVVHADHFQMLYLAAGRGRMPHAVRDWLNRQSKSWMARLTVKALAQADLALVYSGCGLEAFRHWQGRRCLLVEAVNTHVEVQRRILDCEVARWQTEPLCWDETEIVRRVREYAAADYILGPSDFVRESFAQEGFAAARLLKNPYGCRDLGSFQAAERPPRRDQPLRVLYVGQLNLRKGLGYLLEAFARFPAGAMELILVGPTSPPTGLPEALPPGVSCTGVLRGAALAEAYAQAEVFVQPSVEEGLSLVVGEAMHFGLPVVATVSSGAQELFQDETAGLLVAPADSDALFLALERMQQAPDWRHRLGRAGQQLAQGLASAARAADNLAQILQQAWTAWR